MVDIYLSEEIIQDISPQLQIPNDDQVKIIDGKSLILGTGLVDLYSHSGETGYEERETLESLAQAAMAGGFTRVNILPDTLPTIDYPSQLILLQQKASNKVNFSFWGNITIAGKGEKMTQLGELAQAGVVGFTDVDGVKNIKILRRVLEYAQNLNKPIMLMAFEPSLQGNGVIREGSNSLRFGLESIPEFCETIALSSILELVREFKTPVHLMNISTARGVELVKQGKSQNLPITASVSWLHLLLNTDDLANYNSNLKLNPPLGNPWDQLALIEGVKTGILDAIAVDHTPYTYEEKTVAFTQAPCGAIGLELILPLLWTNLVKTNKFTPLELWKRLSYNPAVCLKEKPPSCEIGKKAELTLFDPNKSWLVNENQLQSLSCNTFWLNQELTGKVISF